MNQVQLIGHVGQNPVQKQIGEKSRVVEFSLAVNKRRGDNQETQWFQVEAWNGTGDILMQYVTTGKELYISGALEIDAYINKEGKPVAVAKVTVNQFHFCGKRDNEASDQQSEVVELTTKRAKK